MKKFLSLLLTLALLFSLTPQVVLANDGSEMCPIEERDARAIALVCVYDTWDSIYHMAVTIGTRMRGLPGERESIEWLIYEFDKIGLETEIHEFTTSAAAQNIAYITIHNAARFDGYGAFSQINPATGFPRVGGPFRYDWHGGTWEAGAAANGLIIERAMLEDGHFMPGYPMPLYNREPVTGNVIYVPGVPAGTVELGVVYDLFRDADVEGRIVLIGRGANAIIAQAAYDAGAIALMGHSGVGGRGNFGQAGNPGVTAGTNIPVVGLALAHGEWLKGMLPYDTVTVDILTRRYYTPYSWNAIGIKPAVNDPENAPILYIVGHIDTVIGAPGANDNASGVAVTLEAARALMQLDTPDVELRFVGWGHEEGGLRGAWKYVGRLSVEEGRRIMGVFNMDMTASDDPEYAVYWTMATVDGLPNIVTDTFMATAERLGYGGILEQSQFGSSDHVPFHNAISPPAWTSAFDWWTTHPNRIPAAMGIWMGREQPGMITPSNFTIERYYHTPQDTIQENICKVRLGMCIRIVTAAVYELATLRTDLLAAIARADALVESRYTAASWAAQAPIIAAALEEAERVLADLSTPQADINAAVTALNAAIDDLVRRPVGGGFGGGDPGGGTPAVTPDDDDEDDIDDPEVPLAPGDDYRFTDVRSGNWFYGAVSFVYDNDIMRGVSADMFAPNASFNRAMAATVLFRMAGAEASFVQVFDDVAAGQWYSEAITWAAQNGVVLGIGGNLFDPYANVTREQLAAMFFRYATFMEFDMSTSELANFVDIADVSYWALEAMSWAVHHEIIQGVTGNRLNPRGTATRAECATIIMRMMNIFD